MSDVAHPPLQVRERSAVRDIVDRLNAVSAKGRLSVGDVIEAFGSASFIPLLMVPAILVVSPLSGIPGFSSICGLAIALISAQWLLGRDYVWMPARLRRQSVSEARVRSALRHVRRVADWLDRTARDRFSWMTSGLSAKLPEALCLVCGLSMPFLELVPFSSSLLGLSVLLISAGMLARDGLFIVAAMTTMSLAACVPIAVVLLI